MLIIALTCCIAKIAFAHHSETVLHVKLPMAQIDFFSKVAYTVRSHQFVATVLCSHDIFKHLIFCYIWQSRTGQLGPLHQPLLENGWAD